MAHSVSSTKNNESIQITSETYSRPLEERIGNPVWIGMSGAKRRRQLTRFCLLQAPLAMGGFATTLLTVSLSMMGFRGVSLQTVFVGNLCFVACVGLLIAAQWAMVKGDTFTFTVLTAFGELITIFLRNFLKHSADVVAQVSSTAVTVRLLFLHGASSTRMGALLIRNTTTPSASFS